MAGLFLVTPGAADAAVEAELLDGGEEGGDLELVAADLAGGLDGEAAGEDVIDGPDDETGAEFGGATVAEGEEFGEFVAGLDVEERHGDVGGAEGLFCEAQDADGILAAGEEEGGAFELGGDFAEDVDGLGFELVEVIEMVGGQGRNGFRIWDGTGTGIPQRCCGVG